MYGSKEKIHPVPNYYGRISQMNTQFSSGLEYRSVAENKLSLCGIGSCNDENIVVPAFVEGMEVTSVDSGAFAHNDMIKSVVLPKSVDYIGAEAFAWCRHLESASLSGVLHVSTRAFIGCDSLSFVELCDKLLMIEKKAFAYCSNLTAATLPESLYSLGASAFEGCRGLRSVILPDSLKSIESGTFYACCELESINIPGKLEYIDEFAFAYCISLDKITLPARTVINQFAFYEADGIRMVS